MATKIQYPKNGVSLISYLADDDSKIGDIFTISKSDRDVLKYPEWAPAWDPKDDHAFEHLKPFKHLDKGLLGDPEFKSLKEINKDATFEKVTPNLGSVIDGIQLSSLTDQQKNDLALLVEQRGVIAFRNQDFKDLGFDEMKKWGTYFGPLDIHATSGAPIGHPEFHLVFKRQKEGIKNKVFADKLNAIYWHSDVSYEPQPPGITLFSMLETGLGGDTQFLDCFEIYDRLSPLLKEKLEGLKVVHSSREQAGYSTVEGGIERKDPIDSIHPIVRYHPVLKRKSLYVSKTFSRRILGLKAEESENLLGFLYNHIDTCLDAHLRLKWDENTVVLWDNRRVLHTATADWNSSDVRHAFRLTTMAERPVSSAEEYESWTPEEEERNLATKDYILSLNANDYYEKFLKL